MATDDRFQELLTNGTIHPNMGRNDMAVPESSEPRTAPSRLRGHSGESSGPRSRLAGFCGRLGAAGVKSGQ